MTGEGASAFSAVDSNRIGFQMNLCPIVNEHGISKRLSEIQYDDLVQLEDYDEGYVAEFKSTFDKSVKHELPRIISSFANAQGGWIFVGISDNGEVVNIERTRSDFSQTVGQLVQSCVTPVPKLETRFVHPNEDLNYGVLVIEVMEGFTPPYICRGRVTYRVCSNSVSEHIVDADARILLELNGKARRFKEELNDFCKRTIYYPPSSVYEGVPRFELPIFDVYVKALYSRSNGIVPIEEISRLRNTVSSAFKETFEEQCIFQDSVNSFIARSRVVNSTDDAAFALQMYYDGSFKLYVPLDILQGNRFEDALSVVESATALSNIELASFIDGVGSFSSVLALGKIADYLIDKMPEYFRSRDYSICAEFESTQGFMLYSDNKYYAPYIAKHGIPFFGSLDSRTFDVFLSSLDDNEGDTVLGFMFRQFSSACGLPFMSSDPQLRYEASRMLLGDEIDRVPDIDEL